MRPVSLRCAVAACLLAAAGTRGDVPQALPDDPTALKSIIAELRKELADARADNATLRKQIAAAKMPQAKATHGRPKLSLGMTWQAVEKALGQVPAKPTFLSDFDGSAGMASASFATINEAGEPTGFVEAYFGRFKLTRWVDHPLDPSHPQAERTMPRELAVKLFGEPDTTTTDSAGQKHETWTVKEPGAERRIAAEVEKDSAGRERIGQFVEQSARQ